jgi:ATP-dependent Lon protease
MSIHIPASEGDPATAEVKTSLPEALPVLPLRESVPFPEALTPLAIGQERSIQLINDALAGNRMVVMVASRCPTALCASSDTARSGL